MKMMRDFFSSRPYEGYALSSCLILRFVCELNNIKWNKIFMCIILNHIQCIVQYIIKIEIKWTSKKFGKICWRKKRIFNQFRWLSRTKLSRHIAKSSFNNYLVKVCLPFLMKPNHQLKYFYDTKRGKFIQK